MNSRFLRSLPRVIQWLLGLTVSLLVFYSLMQLYLLVQLRQQASLAAISIETASRPFTQLQREVLRLDNLVVASQHEVPDEDIGLQLDLVRSRLNILRLHHGTYFASEELMAEFDRLYQQWQAIEPAIEAWLLSPTNQEWCSQAHEALRQFEQDVNQLVHKSSVGDVLHSAEQARRFEQLATITSGAGTLFLISLGFTGATLFRTMRQLSLQTNERSLAQQSLEKTNRSLHTAQQQLKQLLQERTTALAASETRLQRLFNQAIDAIYIVGSQGQLLDVNQQMCDRLGYTRQELLQMHVWNFSEGVTKDNYRLLTNRSSNIGIERETNHRRRDGSFMPVEIRGGWLEGSNERTLMVIARDITGRKQTEFELQRREHLFRTLFELAPTGMLQIDLDARIERVNQAVCTVLDCDEETVTQGTLSDLLHPKDLLTVASLNQTLLDGSANHYQVEIHIRNHHGGHVPVLWHVALMRDGRGLPIHFLAQFVDMTIQKQLEQEFVNYQQHLQQVVSERTADLVTTNRRLEQEVAERISAEKQLATAHNKLEQQVIERTASLTQVNRDLETILYIVSHDLKEPLRSIENFSRLIDRRYREQLDEKGQDFLRRIVGASNRMRTLLNDMLQLSRIRKMELPTEPIAAETIVHKSIERLSETIAETKTQVTVADNLPILPVNAVWATEAIYNLLSNAIKYTAADQHPCIAIEPHHSEKGIGIAVLDRGLGVANEQRDRIFELFYRNVGRDVPGTGAGLAIVREVALRHGGDAWVEPRKDGGSKFVVTFSKNGNVA